jgi:CRISPR-associated protein Csb1
MSNVEGGRMRLARLVSSFIEARGVRIAQSGGVKNDRVNASGDTAAGFGNVPFPRTEYTAGSITAFFNVDLRQLQSYGLEKPASDLLLNLVLFKIVKLLGDGMRLRTACDLEVTGVQVTRPAGGSLPTLTEAREAVVASIKECAPFFATPRVTKLTYEVTKESARESKKAAKNKES